MLEFLVISAILGAIWLVMLTITAILDITLEYMQETDQVLIVAPEASAELERIAEQKGSKEHKRFAYDRKSKKAVMVESDQIAEELRGQDLITVDVH